MHHVFVSSEMLGLTYMVGRDKQASCDAGSGLWGFSGFSSELATFQSHPSVFRATMRGIQSHGLLGFYLQYAGVQFVRFSLPVNVVSFGSFL